jgi:hypothetical protein
MRKRVLVTGKNGLVGYALRARLDWGIPNHDFLFVGRTEADLTKENEVESLFKIYKPDIVIHTAAKVGGIGGNINEPAEMFRDNILMNTHLIHHAWKHGVQKFLAFSSASFGNNLEGTFSYREAAQECYSENLIVNRAVNLIAKSCASIELYVNLIGSDGSKTEVKNHSILKLFNKNEIVNGKEEFFETIISYFLISGNAYLCLNKNILVLIASICEVLSFLSIPSTTLLKELTFL